ncbi:thioredoxin fold domain-containing protein [Marinomonas sp. TI.3.20]|uniref:thioredoxin fold domain-containing protein n=1 Tax=Marinomonas sp. TI.3.20 TaxID=3121296 RepID=UPI00312049F5
MKCLFQPLSRFVMISSLLALFSTTTLADKAEVSASIKQALPQYQIENVELHSGSGLYTVTLKDGPTLHVTANGKYFVAGDMYRVEGAAVENESEKAKLAKIETLPASQMIVFKAADEKAHITVFTDVDCAYCRMLHKEVPKLNEMGITVRYLAYPRAGIGSGVYKKMVSVWCSDDPKAWLTKAMEGNDVPENTCVNPIADDYNLGNSIGVRGTPSIVLGNGKLIPGYLPADSLAKELGL